MPINMLNGDMNQANSNNSSSENRVPISKGYKYRGRYNWKNENTRYATAPTSRGGSTQHNNSLAKVHVVEIATTPTEADAELAGSSYGKDNEYR